MNCMLVGLINSNEASTLALVIKWWSQPRLNVAYGISVMSTQNGTHYIAAVCVLYDVLRWPHRPSNPGKL